VEIFFAKPGGLDLDKLEGLACVPA